MINVVFNLDCLISDGISVEALANYHEGFVADVFVPGGYGGFGAFGSEAKHRVPLDLIQTINELSCKHRVYVIGNAEVSRATGLGAEVRVVDKFPYHLKSAIYFDTERHPPKDGFTYVKVNKPWLITASQVNYTISNYGV